MTTLKIPSKREDLLNWNTPTSMAKAAVDQEGIRTEAVRLVYIDDEPNRSTR